MKISKRLRLFFLLPLLILGSILMVLQPKIIKTTEITEYMYGERLITASNIPHSWTAVIINKTYSIVVEKYYPLPKVIIEDKDIQTVFLELLEMPYTEGQLNPNKIEIEGGNCQSFSIYLVTAFRKMGHRAGYLASTGHVNVWLIYDNMLWRVDAVTKEFARVSIRDRLYLGNYIDLEGVE